MNYHNLEKQFSAVLTLGSKQSSHVQQIWCSAVGVLAFSSHIWMEAKTVSGVLKLHDWCKKKMVVHYDCSDKKDSFIQSLNLPSIKPPPVFGTLCTLVNTWGFTGVQSGLLPWLSKEWVFGGHFRVLVAFLVVWSPSQPSLDKLLKTPMGTP